MIFLPHILLNRVWFLSFLYAFFNITGIEYYDFRILKYLLWEMPMSRTFYSVFFYQFCGQALLRSVMWTQEHFISSTWPTVLPSLIIDHKLKFYLNPRCLLPEVFHIFTPSSVYIHQNLSFLWTATYDHSKNIFQSFFRLERVHWLIKLTNFRKYLLIFNFLILLYFSLHIIIAMSVLDLRFSQQ